MQWLMKWSWNTAFQLAGLDLSFDIHYRRLSFHQLELRAHLDGVARALAGRGLSPVEATPGQVPLFIGCLDMHDVAWFPPYREVSVHVPVRPLRDDGAPAFVHLYLPVTTEAALWAGRDVCGMPKLLAEIERTEAGGVLTGSLSVGGVSILETQALAAECTHRSERSHFYGTRGGRVVDAVWELTGPVHHDPEGEGASLRLGNHQISAHLDELLVSTEVHAVLVGQEASSVLRRPVVLP